MQLMSAPDSALPAAPSRNERLKNGSPTLSGTIGAALADPATDRFSEDDAEFLKFHGIYQGDNRDLRKIGKQYSFLVRARLPGGILRAEQYLAFDSLADQFGNQTLRLTSRQSVQLHGVAKSGLGPITRRLHDAQVSTLAACGDVARNVMAPPAPTSRLVEQVRQEARRVSDALLPRTPAYRQIWVQGEPNHQEPRNEDFVDPLYGTAYLPRKFKIAFAIPPLNDVDVFTQCLGLVAIVEAGEIAGYNVLAGGGMGMNFSDPQTYARLADVVGFVNPGQLERLVKAAVTIHRDFGDRSNRKHARLKYVLQERGVAWFRTELESRLGFPMQTARPFLFNRQGDALGWHQQFDGNYFLGLHVPGGRITDTEQYRLKSGLRQVVEEFRPELRLTPSQNLLLTGIKAGEREPIVRRLGEYGVHIDNQATAVRRAAMACPALPTCGRALAEAERMLPQILAQIEQLLAETGLNDEEVNVRMTGCPNGCDRPLLGEIGLVGKAPGKYNLYLGGNQGSTRLNRLFKESIRVEDLMSELRPLFQRFARERQGVEGFGDFCQRAVLNC